MNPTEKINAELQHLAATSKQRPVWLRVGTLFDGTTATPNADILFDAQSITFVGGQEKPPTAADLPPGQTAPDLILPDITLLPCLIEAHAHMFLDGAPVDFEKRETYLSESPAWMLQRARGRWNGILQCGIGAIRDAGDKHGVGLTLAAEEKNRRGQSTNIPFIDSPGAALHHKGRYGAFMGQPMEDHDGPAACVAARVADGADRIKLLVSGIINFKVGKVTTQPQMPVDEVKALVAAAKAHGRQTFAHASGTDGVENSIEGGVNTVEHGFFITQEQLARMRDRNIAWVPTFAPVQLQIDCAKELGWSDEIAGHLRRIIEGHQAMLRKAEAMGVNVVAGSDAGSCGVAHGLGFLNELAQMEQAGMTRAAILQSATAASAAVLNFPEKIGRIAPGHRSRMILTRHDPLASVANLQKEKTILFDGTAIHNNGALTPEGL